MTTFSMIKSMILVIVIGDCAKVVSAKRGGFDVAMHVSVSGGTGALQAGDEGDKHRIDDLTDANLTQSLHDVHMGNKLQNVQSTLAQASDGGGKSQDHGQRILSPKKMDLKSILIGVAIIFFLLVIVPMPFQCIGYCRSRGIRDRLDEMRAKVGDEAPGRVAPETLSDGMQRLAQEPRVLIKQHVNTLQELSGMLGYSIQTANSFDVVSALPGAGENAILSCKEAQDLQAFLAMNLGGALGAAGIDAGQDYAGRDKAPFRIAVGLPQAGGASAPMQVTVPEGMQPGQQLAVATPDGGQVTVAIPPNTWPGQTFPVILPAKQGLQQPEQQGMMGMMQGMMPGSQPNTDTPFLFLERPFAFECCCGLINRPHVDVHDVRGGAQVKLGIITDPCVCCCDMTFSIYVGPNAEDNGSPDLTVRGPGCQPGATCCCGCCGCRACQEVYLEVCDPKRGGQPVAFITKGWAGMTEMVTEANNFYVDFGEVQDPAYKSLILATALFINYRFFEGEAGNGGGGSGDSDGGGGDGGSAGEDAEEEVEERSD